MRRDIRWFYAQHDPALTTLFSFHERTAILNRYEALPAILTYQP